MKGDTIETLCDLQRNSALAAAHGLLAEYLDDLRDAARIATQRMCEERLGCDRHALPKLVNEYLRGWEYRTSEGYFARCFMSYSGAISWDKLLRNVTLASEAYVNPPPKGTDVRKEWDRLAAAKIRNDKKAEGGAQ